MPSGSVTNLKRNSMGQRVKRPIQPHFHTSAVRLKNILCRSLTAASLGWLILLTACSPPTFFLESIESKDVRIRDDRILGQWIMTDPEEDFEEAGPIEVRAGRRGSYTIVAPGKYVLDDDNVYTFTGYLVSLGGRTFIDLVQADLANEEGHKMSDLPETILMHIFPFHIVGRIDLNNGSASMELLDPEWLGDYLENHPGTLEVLEEPGFIISGKEVVQAFLAERGGYWKTWETLSLTRPKGKEP
jgi:hypothetical protein